MRAIVVGVLVLMNCAARAAPLLTPGRGGTQDFSAAPPMTEQHPAAFDRVPAETLAGPLPKSVDLVPTVHQPLDFSGQPRFFGPRRPDLPLLGPAPTPPAIVGLSIGPLRAEGFSATPGKNGRTRFKPHIRLDGVTFLGGSIGGALDAHGGMLTLNWQTGR